MLSALRSTPSKKKADKDYKYLYLYLYFPPPPDEVWPFEISWEGWHLLLMLPSSLTATTNLPEQWISVLNSVLDSVSKIMVMLGARQIMTMTLLFLLDKNVHILLTMRRRMTASFLWNILGLNWKKRGPRPISAIKTLFPSPSVLFAWRVLTERGEGGIAAVSFFNRTFTILPYCQIIAKY